MGLWDTLCVHSCVSGISGGQLVGVWGLGFWNFWRFSVSFVCVELSLCI